MVRRWGWWCPPRLQLTNVSSVGGRLEAPRHGDGRRARCAPAAATPTSRLGTGNTGRRASPVQPQGLTSGVKAVFAGGEHTLVLMNSGTARAFGENTSGTLGTGNKMSSLVPVMVIQPSGIRAMSAGFNHSLALQSDGMLHAFGYNQYGRLGDGTTISRPTAVPVLAGVK